MVAGGGGDDPYALHRGNSGGCSDGVVVRALDVWEWSILVTLWFVAHDGENEGHDVVGALGSAVCARLVGAGGSRIDFEAVVESEGKFRAKLESVVGKTSEGGSPRGMKWSTRTSVVPEALNCASAVAYMLARRLKRSV